jgi:hypothetical protein
MSETYLQLTVGTRTSEASIEINEFKTGYQSGNNLVKDKNGDLLRDSKNISNRWKNNLSQLLTVHYVREIRQTETHTAEPLVPSPSRLEV